MNNLDIMRFILLHYSVIEFLKTIIVGFYISRIIKLYLLFRKNALFDWICRRRLFIN